MKRILTLLFLTFFPLAAFAGGILGTKQEAAEAAPSAPSGPGAGALIQMLAALAIVVVLLKYVMPKVLSKFSGRALPSSTGAIKVTETVSCGAGQLHVVEVRGRALLISSQQAGLSLIADVTDLPAEEPDPFEVALAQVSVQPTVPKNIDPVVAAQLERLSHISGANPLR